MDDDEKMRAEISAEVFDGAGSPPPETLDLKSEPQAEPEKVAEVDEWAGVNPALRARFEQMQSVVQDVTTVKERLQQAERRVGALTNELSAAKKKPDPVQPPQESASWNQFKQDYTELSQPLEDKFKALRDELTQGRPDPAALKAELKAELAREQAIERVEEAHPGWQQMIAAEEFRQWQAQQPPDLQALANSDRPRDAIKMLDTYASYRKTLKSPAQIESERAQRLQASQSVEGRKLIPQKSQSDMTPAELRASLAKEIWA